MDKKNCVCGVELVEGWESCGRLDCDRMVQEQKKEIKERVLLDAILSAFIVRDGKVLWGLYEGTSLGDIPGLNVIQAEVAEYMMENRIGMPDPSLNVPKIRPWNDEEVHRAKIR